MTLTPLTLPAACSAHTAREDARKALRAFVKTAQYGVDADYTGRAKKCADWVRRLAEIAHTENLRAEKILKAGQTTPFQAASAEIAAKQLASWNVAMFHTAAAIAAAEKGWVKTAKNHAANAMREAWRTDDGARPLCKELHCVAEMAVSAAEMRKARLQQERRAKKRAEKKLLAML